jgi:hypothetical protein
MEKKKKKEEDLLKYNVEENADVFPGSVGMATAYILQSIRGWHSMT